VLEAKTHASRHRHLDAVVDATRAFVMEANQHIGGGLSSVELMAALFFGGVARLDVESARAGRRDNLVFSKGHAPASLYFCLWLAGYLGDLDLEDLLRFGQFGNPIPRMPRRDVPAGIDMSTGALGQGLSFPNGLAAADRRLGTDRSTFVVLGDAECSEGQVWEAADTAVRLGLRSLTAIVDVNGFGSGIDVSSSRWPAKWRAFGWSVQEVDGHDVDAVVDALAACAGRGPAVVLARTVKGFGLPEGLAGTNKVHNSAPADVIAHQDLGQPIALARRQVARQAQRPERPAEPAPAVPLTVEALRSFEPGDLVHVKKFGGDLADALRDEHRLAVVSPDSISNSGLERLLATHGTWQWENRESPVFECWIAEQDCASLAAGLTAGGVRGVVFLCEGFVWRMLDSIRESICFPELPVVIVGTSGGLGDSLGPMVQSDSCYSALVDMANLECFEASDANEARLLLAAALATSGPCYLRTPHEELPTLTAMDELRARPLDEGVWILRDPTEADAVVVVAGSLFGPALEAADRLAHDHGLHCRVVQVFSPTRFARLPARVRERLVPAWLPAVSLHNSSPSILGRFLGPRSTALGITGFGECGKPIGKLYELHGLTADRLVGELLALAADDSVALRAGPATAGQAPVA
jgi:transketolase